MADELCFFLRGGGGMNNDDRYGLINIIYFNECDTKKKRSLMKFLLKRNRCSGCDDD